MDRRRAYAPHPSSIEDSRPSITPPPRLFIESEESHTCKRRGTTHAWQSGQTNVADQIRLQNGLPVVAAATTTGQHRRLSSTETSKDIRRCRVWRQGMR